jgi:hypothetical protein
MIAKPSGRLILGVLVVIFTAGVSARAQKVVTVADNVSTALANEELSLANSYNVIRVTNDNVIASPRLQSDGTYDHGLWDFVRGPSRPGKGIWLHDNPLASWLWRHGTKSYRLKGRPSLHIMFFFNSKYPGGMLIVMHVDRFAPGWGSPIDSTRHLFQELIPNIFFGGETDQREIEVELRQRYKIDVSQPVMNGAQ